MLRPSSEHVIDLRTVDTTPVVAPRSAGAAAKPRVAPRSAGLPAQLPAKPPGATVGRSRKRDISRYWIDRAVAVAVLLLLLPVLLVLAALIKLGSRGPVLYTQPRVGMGGELFPFVKFRTMVPGADQMRDEVLGDPDDDMPQRYRSDPRITPVGRFLRRWSLDELPQLINIARGDMAIVGPRPMLPDEVKLLTPEHNRRHDCRPGLTGLWQVSGRKETSWEERMDLDLHYVSTQSVRQDLAIVRRTFSVVLRGEGAY